MAKMIKTSEKLAEDQTKLLQTATELENGDAATRNYPPYSTTNVRGNPSPRLPATKKNAAIPK